MYSGDESGSHLNKDATTVCAFRVHKSGGRSGPADGGRGGGCVPRVEPLERETREERGRGGGHASLNIRRSLVNCET